MGVPGRQPLFLQSCNSENEGHEIRDEYADRLYRTKPSLTDDMPTALAQAESDSQEALNERRLRQ